MNLLTTIKEKLLGERIENTNERYKPDWLPDRFDYRWFDERFAVMSLSPHKPRYRRYGKYKAWICMGPDHILSIHAIVTVDLDENKFGVEVYR